MENMLIYIIPASAHGPLICSITRMGYVFGDFMGCCTAIQADQIFVAGVNQE